MIEFAHPDRLFLLGLVLLYMLAAFWQRYRLERRKEQLFPGPADSGKRKGIVKYKAFLEPALFGLGGVFLVLALAGPQHGRERKVLKSQNIAVTVCIDVSKSMLAEDVAPPAANRIDRARRFTLGLLSRLQGEAIGIAVFAAEGFTLVPLTRDYGYCRYLVENLDEMAVSAPGSSLAAGLAAGRELLAAGKDREKLKTAVVILLSDGEDLGAEPGRAEELAALIHQQGGLVYALGIGSRQPSLIPIRTPDGREIIGYYRDSENNFLTTARVDQTLQKIAAAGGGRALRLDAKSNPREFLHRILNRVSASGRALVVEKRKVSVAAWFLAAAFVTLAAALSRQNSA